MKKEIFRGSGVAIVTPFNESGIDFDSFGRLIDFQIQNKTDAIIVCGTTGESATMPDPEHLAAVEFAVKHTANRVPVIAGTGSNDTAHGIHLSKSAEELGADGLLVVTPYYNKANNKGLVEHYKLIAKSVTLPIVLYNVPSRTGMNFSIDVLDVLADIENIVAIKEASGSLAYALEIADRCRNRLDIYSGNDDVIVPIMSLGGKGVISVLANVLPKETHDICAYYINGEVEKSRDLQIRLNKLIKALFIEVNPIPVKTALNLMGMKVGNLRLPLYEMDESNKQALIAAMKDIGIKLV